jgi:hypothetical protein
MLGRSRGGDDMNAKIAREVRPKERKCYMSERKKKKQWRRLLSPE